MLVFQLEALEFAKQVQLLQWEEEGLRELLALNVSAGGLAFVC